MNLKHNFLTKKGIGAFIFYDWILCGKIFLLVPTVWPRDFDLDFWPTFEKKLNLDTNFWTERDRTLILRMDISCGKTYYKNWHGGIIVP